MDIEGSFQKKRQELLKQTSIDAYTNSVFLIDEAKILYNKKRWARSYFLAACGSEQFVKSFEYRCESISRPLPPIPKKSAHKDRPGRFALMMIVPHLMNIATYNFFAKMSKEKPPL